MLAAYSLISIFADDMKTIPNKVIKDYAMLGAGFSLFFLLDPFNVNNYISNPALPVGRTLQILGEGLVIFICTILSELFTTYVLNLPCDYSKDWSYQIKRKIPTYAVVIILLSGAIGQYFTIIEWSWNKWYYFWTDYDGHFSLMWYMNNFRQDLTICVFLAIYWAFLTNSRMKENKIQELLALNEVIDRTESAFEEKTGIVTIAGESKESLSVSPSDILFIESVANYLNIWHFNDGELRQKRIRSTLKSVEGTLSGYPFLFHCHRAFVVNIRFITHVDGNASGCHLNMFSIDRTIPVSKANIEALRKALSQDRNAAEQSPVSK